MDTFARHVRTASGDAWQAQGRLRAALGGGAAELPGIRLMASGLPWPQWNNGDVTASGVVDLEAVRAWYASRAYGRGVPWGVRVPVDMAWQHGRFALVQRCMGLGADSFSPAPVPRGLTIRPATAADIDALAYVDSCAFGDPIEQIRPWIAPQVGAPGFATAIAEVAGDPVGIATSILTAGGCLGIFGVGVLEPVRRRGIGGGLTSWLAGRGFAAGAILAHLNPDGDDQARIYARLGFVETLGFNIYVDL